MFFADNRAENRGMCFGGTLDETKRCSFHHPRSFAWKPGRLLCPRTISVVNLAAKNLLRFGKSKFETIALDLHKLVQKFEKSQKLLGIILYNAEG